MKRICTFQSVLFAVARARGMKPSTEGIPVDAAETLAEGITEAYGEALNFRDWPEALELDELTVETDAASSLPLLPRRLQNGITLHTVHGIWDKHPAAPGARAIAYQLEPLGYYLQKCHDVAAGDKVWVKYQTGTPKFTAEEFDIVGLYKSGDVVYDHGTGHSYLAIQDSSGYPITDETRWMPQPILEVLRLSVIAGAIAHYLRSEAQDQTARNYDNRMRDLLADEAIRLDSAEQQRETYQR